MWIGVLWAGLRVTMWISSVGGKFRHGLIEKSLIKVNAPWSLMNGPLSFKNGLSGLQDSELKALEPLRFEA